MDINKIIDNIETISEVSRYLGFNKVNSIITNGLLVDSYHPFCYKNHNHYNDYISRYKLYEEIYDTLFSPRIPGPEMVQLHQNFILAEFEFLNRELKNKNYKYSFQYSYLEGTHPWDSLIRDIMNN
jgi:hypothetical protein